MSSILANKFEMNRISSWNCGSVALEKDDGRKYRLEDQLYTHRESTWKRMCKGNL